MNSVQTAKKKNKFSAWLLLRKSLKLLSISLTLFLILLLWLYGNYFNEDAKDTIDLYYYRIGKYIQTFPDRFKLEKVEIIGWPLSETSILIKWAKPNSRLVTSFKLERAKKEQANFEVIARLPGTKRSVEDSNLAPSTEYVYRLTACRLFVCTKVGTKRIRTFNLPPAAPSDLQAVAVSSYQIDLAWKDNSEYETGFKIQREMEDHTFTTVGLVEADQTTFSDCPLIPGKTYTYRLYAYDTNPLVGPFASTQVSFVSPIASATLPAIGRTGKLISIPMTKRIDYFGKASLIQAGKEWGMVFDVENYQIVNEYFLGFNTSFYFQRLDDKFQPIGEKISISSNSSGSVRPSLAWNGLEYAIAWMDYRYHDRDQGIYCEPDLPVEIYFVRVSAAGEKIGNEISVTRKKKCSKYPNLFWNSDHYDLFFWADHKIYYLKLSGEGEAIEFPVIIAEDATEWTIPDIIQVDHTYGISWVGNNNFYFAKFDPEKPVNTRNPKILKISDDREGAFMGGYEGMPPSVFWTGSYYGVCWSEYQSDINVTLISPANLIPIKEFTALSNLRNLCSPAKENTEQDFATQANDLGVHLGHPKCSWNGRTIGIVALKKIRDVGDELSFVSYTQSGKRIGKEKYLRKELYGTRISSRLYWTGDSYVIAGRNHLILIKP